MFTRILFPTNFSDHSRRAIDCIAGLPGLREVVLLHVCDTNLGSTSYMRGSQEEHANDLLKCDLDTLNGLGFVTTSFVECLSGSVPDCIESVAQREKVRLIVMSAGGSGFIKGLHIGSVSHGVIHQSSFNVLLLRYRVIEDMGGERYEKFCPMILSKVLIPTDMSPKSLETVNSISRVPGIGELILIHIIPWGEDPDSIESRMTQAFIVMKQICVDLSHKGISARGDVLIGDPVQTVIRYGEEENVSLISVVPYEKSWLSEVIFGSFTCDLAEQTTRPVLIVKER